MLRTHVYCCKWLLSKTTVCGAGVLGDIQDTVMILLSILKSAIACEPPCMFRDSHFPIFPVPYTHTDTYMVLKTRAFSDWLG